MLQEFPLTSLGLSGCVSIVREDLRYLLSMELLQVLDLRKGNLSTVSNAQIVAIQDLRLTSLDLGGCSLLTDTGLAWLRKMPLTHLDLRGCVEISFAGILEHLEGMSLKYLDLGVLIRRRPPHTRVEALPFPLIHLVLGGFEFDDAAFEHLRALESTLTFLDVRNCVGLGLWERANLRALMAPPAGYFGPKKVLLLPPVVPE